MKNFSLLRSFMDENQAYIFGRNAVLEALNSKTVNIEKIFISFSAQGDAISKIFSTAKRQKVQCVKQDNGKFNNLERTVCPKDAKSQGVIALLQLHTTIELDELIALSFENNKNPIIVALDGITDPHNLGAIARTAECAGASGLLLSERESAPVTPTAIKISAGALEHLPVAKASSFAQAFEILKENDFWIVGTDMDGDQFYYEYDFDRPVVIVIGSEGSGLRPSTKKHCDSIIKIPILGQVSSLNASVSAGVVLYEAVRRKLGGRV